MHFLLIIALNWLINTLELFWCAPLAVDGHKLAHACLHPSYVVVILGQDIGSFVVPCGCPLLGFERPQRYHLELNHPPTRQVMLVTVGVAEPSTKLEQPQVNICCLGLANPTLGLCLVVRTSARHLAMQLR